LYKSGSQDNLVYFVLFGKLILCVPRVFDESSVESDHSKDNIFVGRANIGWTLGEEVLFDKNLQIR
jgi:hypothetical protein